MMALSAVMGVWWCALIVLACGSPLLALLQPWLARRRAVSTVLPPLSVLVPLRRAEEAKSLASLSVAAQDYPSLEVLFSVKEDGGQRAVEHGVVRTAARPGCNPKIANLVEPVERAKHDFLLIKDAATILPPGQLRAMMASFTPGTGLVCAVPVARSPQGFVSCVEAALINGYGARLLLAGSALGIGAGIGAAMLLRRDDLRAIGGLEAIAGAIADDQALARAFALRGLRTAMAARTVDQALERRSAADVWRRHLRWAVCRRTQTPAAFFAEPLSGLVMACLAAWLGAAWLGVSAWPLLAATVLIWPASEAALAVLKGWPINPAAPLAVLVREVAMPVLWFTAMHTRAIEWEGIRLRVSRGSRS